jgi:hypothetical protein
MATSSEQTFGNRQGARSTGSSVIVRSPSATMADRHYGDEPRLGVGVVARTPGQSAGAQLAALRLDGLVLTKDAPSCGPTRVEVHSEHGVTAPTERGRFADPLCTVLAMLPLEEAGRLCDPVIRENFIERIGAFRRVRHLLEGRRRAGDLVEFHTRHKLQLLHTN